MSRVEPKDRPKPAPREAEQGRRAPAPAPTPGKSEGDGNEAERLGLLLAHREVVERQLAEVTGHLRAIDHKIALYEHKVAPTA